MTTKSIKVEKMKFMTRRIVDAKEFLMAPKGYAPNNYKFIDGVLNILNSENREYVVANIALNDLLSDKFSVYVYE